MYANAHSIRLQVAMVGHCNHKDICANCGLRMRICYDKMACPLCKAELKEVVMTPWRPEGVPDWTNLQRDMHHMWTNLSWVRGVFVDNRQVEGLAKRRRPLSSELEARTGRTCSICDPAADRVFPSNRSLMRHMELEHSKFLCKVCIAVSSALRPPQVPMGCRHWRRASLGTGAR